MKFSIFSRWFHRYQKGDRLILAGIFLIGILGVVGFYRFPSEATTIKIYVASREYASYRISDNFQKDVEIRTEYGYNLLRIQNSAIQLIESDCPNHDCLRMGTASNAGEILVCLPHQLLIRVEGGGNLDALSY